MPATIKLSDIVDAIELQFDDFPSFLDLETGEVHTIPIELLREAEKADDQEPELPAWEKPQWEAAKLIATTDRFRRLPGNYEVHEWEIMREFADGVGNERASEDLRDALHGSGAFRHFKSTLGHYRLESAWFEFRAGALRRIAIEWCEEHGIPWR